MKWKLRPFLAERYRLPIVPGLLIFAAVGLVFFVEQLRQRKVGYIASYLVLLLAGTFITSCRKRTPAFGRSTHTIRDAGLWGWATTKRQNTV